MQNKKQEKRAFIFIYVMLLILSKDNIFALT